MLKYIVQLFKYNLILKTYFYDVLVIDWLHTKLNNCEIIAKSSSNCAGVLSEEITDATKNANCNKTGGKFSTSTPASAESV